MGYIRDERYVVDPPDGAELWLARWTIVPLLSIGALVCTYAVLPIGLPYRHAGAAAILIATVAAWNILKRKEIE